MLNVQTRKEETQFYVIDKKLIMNRTRIIMLLFLGTFCFPIISQGQIKINPKLGVNASNLETDIRDLTAEARVGWNLGLDLRMGGGMIFFNPGIHYYSFAADLTPNITSQTNFDVRNQTTIQNIKVPVNIGINLTGSGGLLNIWVKGGGSANFFGGVKQVDGSSLVSDDFSKVNFGLNLGVGVDVLFVTVDATYELGQTNFFAEGESRNNMLTVSAGIKF